MTPRACRHVVAALLAALLVCLVALPGLAAAQVASPRSATAVPVLSRISTKVGSTSGGVRVTLRGNHLADVRRVWFGTVRARGVHVVGQRRVRVTVPPHKDGRVRVTVAAHGRHSRGVFYTYEAPQQVAPVITAVTPGEGLPGDVFVVTGTGFDQLRRVVVGGVDAGWRSASPTEVAVVAPAHAVGAAPVSVTTAGGASAAGAAAVFTYVAPDAGPPVVQLVEPSYGPVAGGTVVHVTGVNLAHASQVTFGGVPATSVVADAAGNLDVTAPPHTPGAVPVQVTNRLGTSAPDNLTSFGYQSPQPMVRQLEPYLGAPVGGTRVTVSGSGFTGATGVSFGGVPGTGVTVLSDNELQVTAPAHVQEVVDVDVRNAQHTSFRSWGSKFTVTADPSIQVAQLPLDADLYAPDLSLGDVACPAPGSCVAVGDYVYGDPQANGNGRRGLVETLRDGEWRPTALSQPADREPGQVGYGVELTDVECPSVSLCVAVGEYLATGQRSGEPRQLPLVYRWDGAAWSVVPVTIPGGPHAEGELHQLDCTSTTSCTAIGTSCSNGCVPLAETMTGTTWSASLPVSGHYQGASLNDLDCWAPDGCLAVGRYSTPYDSSTQSAALWARWDGQRWTTTAGVAPADVSRSYPDTSLESVSCTVDGCHALGRYRLDSADRQAYLSVITTAGETVRRLPTPADAAPDARIYTMDIACPTFDGCRALADYRGTNGFYRTLEAAIGPTTTVVDAVPSQAGSPYIATVGPLVCPIGLGCTAAGYEKFTQLGATVVTTGLAEPPAPYSLDDYDHQYAYSSGLSRIVADSSSTAVAVGNGGSGGGYRLGLLVTGLPVPPSPPPPA